MPEIPKIVLPHGGYRSLIVYKKSDVIYEGTVLFCRRFLPARGDRTVDQMVQAAQSCKQNIAEGSAAGGTSKETESSAASHAPQMSQAPQHILLVHSLKQANEILEQGCPKML